MFLNKYKQLYYVVILGKKLLFLGAYVPLIMQGTIMVDGILASCYPSVDHTLGHIGMTPLRWIPWMVEQIYGEDSGFPGYVEMADIMSSMIPYQKQ